MGADRQDRQHSAAVAAPAPYSSFAPVTSITRFQRACSSAISAANSCGVLKAGIADSFVICCSTAALLSAVATAVLSLLITSAGTPAGAISPYQPSDTTLGSPASAVVGTSGRNTERVGLVTASTRAEPAVIRPITPGRSGIIVAIWPPSRSFEAGAAPRYGTCTSLTFASMLSSSPARWVVVPAPADPNDNFPDAVRAAVSRSASVLYSLLAATRMTASTRTTRATGTMSRLTSYGTLVMNGMATR